MQRMQVKDWLVEEHAVEAAEFLLDQGAVELEAEVLGLLQ